MKELVNSDDRDDDDDDDCCTAIHCETEELTAAPEVEGSNSSSKDITARPVHIPLVPTPLLLKSRIHAGGARVEHELARGVPGFWGPPASHVVRLYSALTEVLS